MCVDIGVRSVTVLGLQEELSGDAAGWVTHSDNGPLWDRSFAMQSEAQCTKQATEALRLLGAERMVVGHTVTQSGGIETRCGD